VETVVAIAITILGVVLTVRFRRAADWFDRVLRALADGPGSAEPERRGVVGQVLMVGTGSSTPARWWRYGAVLLTGLMCFVLGLGEILGAWDEL
jgi:anti-sigma factor RsiW